MREVASLSPEAIRARVRAIAQETGARRLVITTTGTPLEPIPANVEANYHAMIDACLETGT